MTSGAGSGVGARRVVVTGSGGYVGGRLVGHLTARGADVRPLVRRSVPWVSDGRVVRLVGGDLDELAGALEGHDAVVHLAGASEVRAAADPDGALADTVVASRRVAAAAVRAGVPRVVVLSTVHVYGSARRDTSTVDEGVVPEPRHPYAVARLAGEHLVAGEGPDEVVVLRLTNGVGPPADARVDRWTLVANELCAAAAAGQPLRLRTSGRQWRDLIDLGDACHAIGEAALGVVPAGTYNLGSGCSTTIRALAEAVADAAEVVLGSRPPVEAPPHEGPEPARQRVDVSRLAAHVNPPTTPLAASLQATIRLCAGFDPRAD